MLFATQLSSHQWHDIQMYKYPAYITVCPLSKDEGFTTRGSESWTILQRDAKTISIDEFALQITKNLFEDSTPPGPYRHPFDKKPKKNCRKWGYLRREFNFVDFFVGRYLQKFQSNHFLGNRWQFSRSHNSGNESDGTSVDDFIKNFLRIENAQNRCFRRNNAFFLRLSDVSCVLERRERGMQIKYAFYVIN